MLGANIGSTGPAKITSRGRADRFQRRSQYVAADINACTEADSQSNKEEG